MTRSDYVLAILASGRGEPLSPVQVQKLFFILDQRLGARLGGPHFRFEPYHYGPFDPAVYREIDALARAGYAEVAGEGQFTLRRYRVTPEGLILGKSFFAGFALELQEYIDRIVEFVRTKSFQDLVSAIYKEWPEMRARSVFRE